MICLICRQAEALEGLTSVTFERDEFRLEVKRVPARVCPGCGEAYVEEEVAIKLLREAEAVSAQGRREAVCEYQ
jgi:YgiT-type zinc finger domain-containing protein